jgi:hypothetical protein
MLHVFLNLTNAILFDKNALGVRGERRGGGGGGRGIRLT